MKPWLTTLSLLTTALVLSQPMASLAQTKAKSTTSKPTAVHAATAPAAPVAAALSADELALAPNVYIGRQNCEAGVHVTVTPDAKSAGYFHVQVKNHNYHMRPVVTTSGAVRLEDKKEGAIWLQMSNKSMMMHEKLGQRLADDCMNADQTSVAIAMKNNPQPSILEAAK